MKKYLYLMLVIFGFNLSVIADEVKWKVMAQLWNLII